MLVELLVGMILTALTGTIILQVVIGGFRTQRVIESRGEALAVVRAAVQRITRDIRQSDEVLQAQDSLIEIRRSAGSGTVKERWEMVTTSGVGQLQQTVTTYNASGAIVGGPTSSALISDLDPSLLPFTYSHVDGFTVPVGSPVNPDTCAITGFTPLSYARECVGLVTVQLLRQVKGGASIPLRSTVDLRNRS